MEVGGNVAELTELQADDLLSDVLTRKFGNNFNARWDMGLQTSLLASDAGENRQYSYGASVGYNLAQNMWLSLGYDGMMGFDDNDFSAVAYSSSRIL